MTNLSPIQCYELAGRAFYESMEKEILEKIVMKGYKIKTIYYYDPLMFGHKQMADIIYFDDLTGKEMRTTLLDKKSSEKKRKSVIEVIDEITKSSFS